LGLRVATRIELWYYMGMDGRRSMVPSPKRWQVSEMWDRHHEVARLISLGYKNTEIAEKLGCTPQSVSMIRNSPVVGEQVGILQGVRDKETVDINKRIRSLVPKCLDVVEECLEDEKVPVSVKAMNAFKLMAVAGHTPPKNHFVQSTHTLRVEDIEAIKERALQIARQEGTVIDVEPDDIRELPSGES
jgi:predicted transcriptional regulator